MPGPASGQSLRVLAFYDPRAEKPTGTVQQLLAANRSALSDLAPLWYKVMPDGSVRDLSQNHLKTFARRDHISLMPLVVNENGTGAFLTRPAARDRAVAALAAILQREGYDGLNIDFELLKPGARGGLVGFVRQLHARTQAMHKLLTVDVIPAGSRRQARGAYDFPALARDSDELVLMTYDAHDDGSAPGPVAPLSWVRRRVDVALALGVPRGKILLGLADYGYDWPAHGRHARTLGLRQIDALLAAHHLTPRRTRDGSPHFTYTVGGVRHTVWYEDGRSVLPKIRLARQLGLHGLALWMAGYETAHYWHALRAAAGTATGTAAFTPPVPATPPVQPAAAPAFRAATPDRTRGGASSAATAPRGAAAATPTGTRPLPTAPAAAAPVPGVAGARSASSAAPATPAPSGSPATPAPSGSPAPSGPSTSSGAGPGSVSADMRPQAPTMA